MTVYIVTYRSEALYCVVGVYSTLDAAQHRKDAIESLPGYISHVTTIHEWVVDKKDVAASFDFIQKGTA